MNATNNSLLISNGNMNTAQGWRQVAFSPEGEVRPVQSVRTRGYVQQCCTKQIAREGDFIWRHEYYPHKFQIFILKNGTPSLEATLSSFPIKIGAELKKWLEAVGMQESYLPVGCGWDGDNTVASSKRESRIRNVFKGVDETIVDTYYNYAINTNSPRDGLPCSWKEDSLPLPTQLDCPAEYWDSSLASVRETTEWILYHYDGTVEHLVPEPTEGSWGDGYAHTASGNYNAPALPMPTTVRSAIRVRLDPYRRDSSSWGISWELYRRDKR